MELMFELLMGRIIMSLFNLCFDTMKYVGVGVNYDLQFCTKLVNALKVLLNFCNFLFDGVCVSGKGFVGLVVDLLGNMVQSGSVLEDSFLQGSYLVTNRGYFILKALFTPSNSNQVQSYLGNLFGILLNFVG